MTTLRFPEERTVEEGARYHFKFAQCIYSNRDLQQEGNARQGSKQSPLHARRRFGGRATGKPKLLSTNAYAGRGCEDDAAYPRDLHESARAGVSILLSRPDVPALRRH